MKKENENNFKIILFKHSLFHIKDKGESAYVFYDEDYQDRIQTYFDNHRFIKNVDALSNLNMGHILGRQTYEGYRGKVGEIIDSEFEDYNFKLHIKVSRDNFKFLFLDGDPNDFKLINGLVYDKSMWSDYTDVAIQTYPFIIHGGYNVVQGIMDSNQTFGITDTKSLFIAMQKKYFEDYATDDNGKPYERVYEFSGLRNELKDIDKDKKMTKGKLIVNTYYDSAAYIIISADYEYDIEQKTAVTTNIDIVKVDTEH